MALNGKCSKGLNRLIACCCLLLLLRCMPYHFFHRNSPHHTSLIQPAQLPHSGSAPSGRRRSCLHSSFHFLRPLPAPLLLRVSISSLSTPPSLFQPSCDQGMPAGSVIWRPLPFQRVLVLLSVSAWMLLGLPRAAAFACAARRTAVAAAPLKARASPNAFTSKPPSYFLRATGECLVERICTLIDLSFPTILPCSHS